jgi:hypothetical protein
LEHIGRSAVTSENDDVLFADLDQHIRSVLLSEFMDAEMDRLRAVCRPDVGTREQWNHFEPRVPREG